MSRKSGGLFFFAVTISATLAVPKVGAQAALTPPAIMQTICEPVKPGMGPAHDKNEIKWSRAAEQVKGAASALALVANTGPSTTCWLTSLDSYAAIGKSNAAYDGDAAYGKAVAPLIAAEAQYVGDARVAIARLRTDLSAGTMPSVLTRWVTEWSEFRIRPGQEALFEAAVKAYAAVGARAGVKMEFRVYEVRQGVPAQAYWIFSSDASWAAFDQMLANDTKLMGAFNADDQKLFADFFSKAVVSINANIWTYNSELSILTAEQRATDPFFKRKPAAKP